MVAITQLDGLFWGITLDGEKRYNQTVEDDFHVSMAALEPGSSKNDGVVSIMLQHDQNEFLLCTLQQGKLYQQALDLNFACGETVTFFLTGKGRVHLSGYMVPETDENFPEGFASAFDTSEADSIEDSDASDDVPTLVPSQKRKTNKKDQTSFKRAKVMLDSGADEMSDSDDDDDEDISEYLDLDEDSDDEDESMTADKLAGGDFEEMWETDSEDEEEVIGSKKSGKKSKDTPKAKASADDSLTQSQKKKNKKKRKRQSSNSEMTSPNGVSDKESATPKSAKKGDTPAEKKTKANTPGSANKQANTPGSGKKNKGKAGIQMQDLKEGHGPEPRNGQMIGVYYTGKLPNGKVFDSHTSGKVFKFNFGKKEVIQGWDMGLKGMKVGGKRKLTIPPKFGYGDQKMGVIPPNTTLTFDVELRSVH